MGIKLKNMDKVPDASFETVDVLGLSIPKTSKLPFGATVQYIDLVSKRDAGLVGSSEFYFRLFCLFTWRLPRDQRVTYEWLSDQRLEKEEIEDIVRATNQLLIHYADGNEEEGGEEEEGKPKRKARKAN